MTVTPARRRPAVGAPLVIVLVALAAACGPVAPTASPGPSSGTIDTPAAAVAAIRDRVPLFDGLEARDPELVGQAASWMADPTGSGWRVTFEVGWGDCQAGCIDRHTWAWDVTRDGSLRFVGEAGSPLDEATLSALKAGSTRTGVAGRAVGGPTCPVERPGDPACAPRLVGDTTLTVTDAGGAPVATVITDGSGYFRLALPPGDYVLESPAVEGFMSGPAPLAFTVPDGAETWLDLAWDTGIR